MTPDASGNGADARMALSKDTCSALSPEPVRIPCKAPWLSTCMVTVNVLPFKPLSGDQLRSMRSLIAPITAFLLTPLEPVPALLELPEPALLAVLEELPWTLGVLGVWSSSSRLEFDEESLVEDLAGLGLSNSLRFSLAMSSLLRSLFLRSLTSRCLSRCSESKASC